MFVLRKYQNDVLNDLRRLIQMGCRRLLLVAATGSGKTVIAAQLVRAAIEKDRRVMFLAHRRELVNQCSDKLIAFGVDHGIIMSKEFLYGAADCQVASIDTLRARCLTTQRLPLPRADVIIIDEAHRSLSDTYMRVIKEYPYAVVIGLTATPIRGDGKGLGHVYEGMAETPSIQKLIEMGYLVPAITFAPTIPDLTGVPVRNGDYDPAALNAAMNKRELVGDVITHWHRLASDRKTVVFASGVKHSINLRDEFRKSGVNVAHVDGDTPIIERKQIVNDLKVGNIQVVCNYGVFTEGFDEPSLSACVLARATKNLGLNLQMAGRTLRPFANKKDSLIIDHGGNVYEHGFVSDERNWVLEEGRALTSTNKERQQELDEKKPITCVECSTVYTGQINCPTCGHIPEKKGKHYESRSGELMEVRAEKRRSATKRIYTTEEKQAWYSMFLQHTDDKTYDEGWASHKYKEKFGVWPRRMRELRQPITPECRSYIRYLNIRNAKGRAKNETNNEAGGAR